MFTLERLLAALVVAIVVGLAFTLLGLVLGTFGIPIAETIGDFLAKWAWVIGVLAGLWQCGQREGLHYHHEHLASNC